MEKYKLPYHSISAKTGNNIESLFYAVVDMINEHQVAKQKKYKLKDKEDDESHYPPMTEKPLKI